MSGGRVELTVVGTGIRYCDNEGLGIHTLHDFARHATCSATTTLPVTNLLLFRLTKRPTLGFDSPDRLTFASSCA